MLKKPKNKEKTVAEKVAENILHPNRNGSDSDTADEAAAPRVIEFDSDEYELPQVGTTEFRKRNIKLLSDQNAKYKGKIACRKDLDCGDSESDEDFENSDSSIGNESVTALNSSSRNKNIPAEQSDTDEQASEDDNGEESGDIDDEFDDSEHGTEDEGDDTEVVSKINHEDEIQKGLCVQNQLRIWERLLELRMSLQKIINKSSHLPPPQDLKGLLKNDDKEIKETTCKQTCLLLQNLLMLKNNLSSQFSEVVEATKTSRKRPLPFKEHDSSELPFKQISQYLEEDFQQFRPYRNDILLKWDDRTRLLQPGAGSKKKTLNEEYDITQKINNALLHKSLLIEKSQQLRNPTLNESAEEIKRDPNIYDDTDFYHQQLRELIEYKANTSSNMSEVTKQYLELQKLRQKMKKKVDTRASKGRKLRYIVHNKLINFMAPHDNGSWTMESVDELSKSLFV